MTKRAIFWALLIGACGGGSTSPPGNAEDGEAARGGEGEPELPETCGDGLDDDGDGVPDGGCTCEPGLEQGCFPGDPAQAGVGECALGRQACVLGFEIGEWGDCEGAVLPAFEACNGLDDDCDGEVDDDAGCGDDGHADPDPDGDGDGIDGRDGDDDGDDGDGGDDGGDDGIDGEGGDDGGGDGGDGDGDGGDGGDGGGGDGGDDGNGGDGGDGGGGDGVEEPCLDAGLSPWQEILDPAVVCWWADLDEDPAEFAFATIPAADDPRWQAREQIGIDFDEASTLPDGFCDGRGTGGVFTYFQTFLRLPEGMEVGSLVITYDEVDDASEVRLFNERFPDGRTEDAWRAFDDGQTSDLAPYLAAGENRIVITHIDDNRDERALRDVRVILDEAALPACE